MVPANTVRTDQRRLPREQFDSVAKGEKVHSIGRPATPLLEGPPKGNP